MKKIITFLTLLTLFFITAGARTVTDVLNSEVTGINTNYYTNFSGKTLNSTAVYAGICAGQGNTIQLRDGSYSGIVTTASGGKVRRITVTWDTQHTASGRRISIYGKNEAYTKSNDLYSSNANIRGVF